MFHPIAGWYSDRLLRIQAALSAGDRDTTNERQTLPYFGYHFLHLHLLRLIILHGLRLGIMAVGAADVTALQEDGDPVSGTVHR